MPVTLRGQPLARLNELEWVDGQVLANVWQTDIIVRIDPTTRPGQRHHRPDRADARPVGLDPTDAVLNGIAWDADGRRLFVTGKNWPTLFEIRLTGAR